MFRFIINGSLKQHKININQYLLYSTKVSPKRILSTPHENVNSVESKSETINIVRTPLKLPVSGIVNNKIVGNDHIALVEPTVSDAGEKETQKKVINWQTTPSSDLSLLPNQYLMLSKFRLTSLVVITTMVGYAMAPAPFVPTTFLLCSIGTGLCSAAANAINQYHEVPFDAQMSRTRNRVLVRGQLTPLHAINFAIASTALGAGLLYFGVNGYVATLGIANLILYTSIYTPMKRISILNTWIGSVVGAIPPIMGWVGCTGSLDPGCFLLGALLYTWQFPHFNALSWNLRPDYSRAGYRMMAVSHPALCRRTALRHTIGLTALCGLAPLLDVTNVWFALETLPLNAYFSYLAYKFYRKSDSGSSRELFRFSLIQLPILMILFFINKKEWMSKVDESNKLKQILTTGPISSATTVAASI